MDTLCCCQEYVYTNNYLHVFTVRLSPTHALGSHPVGMGDVQRHPCTRVWWFGGIVIHDARSIRYALRIVFR